MCRRISLLCVDKYRKQQWVPDKEDWCVVTHQVPDAIFRVKFQSKASRISAIWSVTQCTKRKIYWPSTMPWWGEWGNWRERPTWKTYAKIQSIPFIPLAHAECDDSLPFSGASSIPLCYVLFPATLLHQLFFHPLSPHLAHLFLGLPLSLVVPKFIYNTLLGILLSSILCICPNQHNLFNLNVSITEGFLTLA